MQSSRILAFFKPRTWLASRQVQAAIILALVAIGSNGLYLTKVVQFDPDLRYSGLQIPVTEHFLRGEPTIDPNLGFNTHALGKLALNTWLNGSVPWWNYYQGVGMPLAGEMQSAVFFPLVVLNFGSIGPLLMHIALQFMAGLALYYLFVRLKIRHSVALVSGILFSLGSSFVWLQNAPLNPVAFLPLTILGVELAIARAQAGKRGGWGWLAVAVALSLYAGFPETAYLNALIAAGWAVVRLIGLRQHRQILNRSILKLVAGGGVALALAAPIIIAFLEYILSGAFVGSHTGDAAAVGLPHLGLSALLMPYIYGSIFGYSGADGTGQLAQFWGSVGVYFNVALLPLAVLAFSTKTNRLLKLFLAVWFVIFTARIFTLGPVHYLTDVIPGVKSIAIYRYIGPTLELALLVLAAFGTENLLQRRVSRRDKWLVGLGSLAIVLFASGYAYHQARVMGLFYVPTYSGWFKASVVAGAMLTLAVTAFIILRVHRYRWQLAAAVLIVGWSATAFMLPQLSAPRKANIDLKPVTYLQQNVGLGRVYSLGRLMPNYAGYYGFASVNSNDLPLPADWEHYLTTKLDRNTDSVNFTGLNRKNVLGPSATDELVANLPAFKAIGVNYVIDNVNSPNRSQLEPAGLVRALSSDTAAVYKVPDAKPYYSFSKGSCKVSKPLREQVSLHCEQPATLERQEQYLAGWSTSQPNVKIVRSKTNSLFQQMTVPAGTYTLKFAYAPPFVGYGWIAFVGGLGALIWAGWPLWGRRKP